MKTLTKAVLVAKLADFKVASMKRVDPGYNLEHAVSYTNFCYPTLYELAVAAVNNGLISQEEFAAVKAKCVRSASARAGRTVAW